METVFLSIAIVLVRDQCDTYIYSAHTCTHVQHDTITMCHGWVNNTLMRTQTSLLSANQQLCPGLSNSLSTQLHNEIM